MRRFAVLLAFVLLASACGDDPAGIDVAPPGDESTTTTTTATTTTTTPTTTTIAPAGSIELCDEVERAVPSVIGTLPGGTNLPSGLTAAARRYADDHPETFAEIWIDREYGGTLVLAFTDDPANHLPNLPESLRNSDQAVDVVQVDFSQTALRALQDDVGAQLSDRDDITLFGVSGGGIENRVGLNLGRPTAQTLELIAAEFPGRAAMLCLEGGLWDESMAPPSVDDPFTVMADAGDDPLVTCSSAGPFPLSRLDGEPDVQPDTTDPAERALLDSQAGGRLPFPTEGWRTLVRDEEAASYYWFDGSSFLIHELENTPGGWTVRGTSAGSGEDGCRLRLHVGDGVGLMNIGLDPGNPVDPTSSTLHLLVAQSSCSGGASGVENMRPPEVIETDTEIRLAIAVVPHEGPQTCPGNALAPITIELDSPIGDRAILDGIQIPAKPLEDAGF